MRKILAITSSRADREPLMPVIKALGDNCIHEHGDYTDSADGDDIPHLLKCHQPDIVLLLGDQYLTLLHATMVANCGMPIVHVHGGDETLGAVDNVFRHAITKLAYWHFPSCQLHAERIIQMGEAPERIFPIGAPGIDALAQQMMTKEECEAELGIMLESPIALVCYHPATLGSDDMQWTEDLHHYSTVIISGSNSDIGGDEINGYWQEYHTCYHFQKTYSQRLWLSLMRYADVLIGNSSGFIIEGMTLQQMNNDKPQIKIIGDRQKGRYEEALQMFAQKKFPFGKPSTVAKTIANKLMTIEIPEKPRKVFHVV